MANMLMVEVESIFTNRQKNVIKRMTGNGYARKAAIRKLINLGIMVSQFDKNSKYSGGDLEHDLKFGTHFVMKEDED